jgi:hypothetical protein
MLVGCVRQRLLDKRRRRHRHWLYSTKRRSTKCRSTNCHWTTTLIRLHWKRFGASSSTTDPVITDSFSGLVFALYLFFVFSSSFSRNRFDKILRICKHFLIKHLIKIVLFKYHFHLNTNCLLSCFQFVLMRTTALINCILLGIKLVWLALNICSSECTNLFYLKTVSIFFYWDARKQLSHRERDERKTVDGKKKRNQNKNQRRLFSLFP